jgi:hypothetical protein
MREERRSGGVVRRRVRSKRGKGIRDGGMTKRVRER